MKIALIASESNPFCKSGGLADVVFSLAKEFIAAGHEAIVVIPLYRAIHDKMVIDSKPIGHFDVNLSWRVHTAEIWQAESGDVPFYFVGDQYYFGRDNLYGYDDDGERFAFFSLAAKKLLELLPFHADIIHVHDWQTAIIPLLLRKEGEYGPLGHSKTVLTIHNPAFLGLLGGEAIAELFNLQLDPYEWSEIKVWDKVSTLLCGIAFANRITTVSPTHAGELRQNNAYEIGNTLVRRGSDFVGIVNGVDMDEFDPSKDELIAKKFSTRSLANNKKLCKKDLFEAYHMPFNDGPTFVLVSRLYEQKGIPLVLDIAEHIVGNGGNLFILGSGEYSYCQAFEGLRAKHPDHIGVYFGYAAKLSHQVYAGGDFFLMPSLFEPCGISQMIAQRYACLPVARDTGGLHDTIIDGVDGFLFSNYDYGGIRYGVDRALGIYRDQEAFAKMQLSAMKKDHSWKRSADEYLYLFASLL